MPFPIWHLWCYFSHLSCLYCYTAVRLIIKSPFNNYTWCCIAAAGNRATIPLENVVPHLYLYRRVCDKLAKSTRLPGSLPVFYHFYPSTRFFKFLPVLGIPISKKKIKKNKKIKFFVLFLPVNIGEIRELINHFRSYRP